ncbi:MAG: alpha/beta fold hydrolase [Proteobacteria bacterium]|nr:alpha/beta fold hydrolase [Pseudomonadota bacterium]
MIRSAYLTTGLAIKVFSSLSKANIFIHGQENLPTGPIIFVMNHFTRIETLLLPYYIYKLTHKPVFSLAAASLFKGGLEKFFDMVGVISTDDPKRDELIVKNLLTGAADWIIFPEGSMVKTKKIMEGGRYMVAAPNGMHEPHTGAAALALRAELYRTHLLQSARTDPGRLRQMLEALGIASLDEIVTLPTTIVPVNLTYYPIRTAENIALNIVGKLVKDMSERMVEEIMTEGTMLLSGVDLDIRFGKPIKMTEHLQQEWLQEDMGRQGIKGYSVSPELKGKMRSTAYRIMQQYMHDIYAMTTINHEHLMAAFLRMYPFKQIKESELKRRIFYAASLVTGKEDGKDIFFLHRSLYENQAHLLTDDRFRKYANFFKLAEEKGVVKKLGENLVCDRCKLSGPLSVQRGRIDNPVEVMANEVEPLQKLSALLRRLAWLPSPLIKIALIRYLLKCEKLRYAEGRAFNPNLAAGPKDVGQSFLLPAWRRKLGVVLVHSYFSSPEQVRDLAGYLRRRGVWVFAPRLPGHGTSAEDLATRKYREWVEAVENGYVLMSTICQRVVLGGIAFGGNLVLDLAGRVESDTLAGVFAISPPLALKNYSSRIIPATDVWNRLLNKMKREEKNVDFLDLPGESHKSSYTRNPVSGIMEVGEFLESIEERYDTIKKPALILQAEKNPVVDPKGSQQLFAAIGSASKEFCLLSDDRHILVNGEGAGKVFAKIAAFIDGL